MVNNMVLRILVHTIHPFQMFQQIHLHLHTLDRCLALKYIFYFFGMLGMGLKPNLQQNTQEYNIVYHNDKHRQRAMSKF
jgi:hypothetical protein